MVALRRILEEARWRHLAPWLCGFAAAVLAAKNLLGSYADLGIYLDVARELRAGGFDLCREREGSGPWVYPPAAALPFVALDGLLGDRGARVAWSLSLGLATVWLLQSLATVTATVGGLRWWQWLAFGLLFQRCIAQNLTHGQLSLWVGTLVTAGIADLVRHRDGRAGLWLGLAAALKVTPWLFLLALPLMGRSRAAAAMAATTAIVVLVLPWPFCGTNEHLRHLHDFWQTATAAVTAPESSAIVQRYAGPSVNGAFDYLLQPRTIDREGHTVNVAHVDDATLRAVKIGWSLLLGSLLLTWFLRARAFAEGARLAQQAAVVVLAMSLFSPLLRVYHLAAALVPFALFCRGPAHRRDMLWWLAAAGALLAMTMRQKKLLGETLWRAFDGGAFLHVTIVLMLVWLLRAARVEGQPSAAPADLGGGVAAANASAGRGDNSPR